MKSQTKSHAAARPAISSVARPATLVRANALNLRDYTSPAPFMCFRDFPILLAVSQNSLNIFRACMHRIPSLSLYRSNFRRAFVVRSLNSSRALVKLKKKSPKPCSHPPLATGRICKLEHVSCSFRLSLKRVRLLLRSFVLLFFVLPRFFRRYLPNVSLRDSPRVVYERYSAGTWVFIERRTCAARRRAEPAYFVVLVFVFVVPRRGRRPPNCPASL